MRKGGNTPVDNRGTTLIVFLFRDPHLLEGGERGEDGSTDPNGVFTFRRSNNFNLSVNTAIELKRGGRDTFMEDGARAVISFCILSAMPGYMVVPPD